MEAVPEVKDEKMEKVKDKDVTPPTSAPVRQEMTEEELEDWLDSMISWLRKVAELSSLHPKEAVSVALLGERMRNKAVEKGQYVLRLKGCVKVFPPPSRSVRLE